MGVDVMSGIAVKNGVDVDVGTLDRVGRRLGDGLEVFVYISPGGMVAWRVDGVHELLMQNRKPIESSKKTGFD